MLLIRCKLCAADRDHRHTIDMRALPILLADRDATRTEFIHGSERFECTGCGTITIASGLDAGRFPFVYDPTLRQLISRVLG